MTGTNISDRKCNVVVVLQHENWEDDGGDHDPVLISVTPADLKILQDGEKSSKPNMVTIRKIIDEAPIPSLPCTIEAVLNIWHEF